MSKRSRKQSEDTPATGSATPGLTEYRRKRDFSRTAEPAGGEGGAPRSSTGRLYCIQKHQARRLHYDLRLEMDGALKSWAVPKGPSLDPAHKPLAVQTEDHPIEYGGFEGVIPAGQYGAGTVMLWDTGEWEPLADPVEGLAKGDFKFRLHGAKLRGDWALVRIGKEADGKNWLLLKKKDAEARPLSEFDVQAHEPRSALTGRTMREVAADPKREWTREGERPAPGRPGSPSLRGGRRASDARAAGEPSKSNAGPAKPPAEPGATPKSPAEPGATQAAQRIPGARKAPMPAEVKPQLAMPSGAAPEGDAWLHEVKLDGYRLVGRLDEGAVELRTRNGHDWTNRFEAVATSLARLPAQQAIVDGEVVVLDSRGVSDFQALQNAFRGYTKRAFVYYLFDLMYLDGYDLRKSPLHERKKALRTLLEAAPLARPAVQYCEHIRGRGPIVLEQAIVSGIEGIVSKRATAPYESRRVYSWLKIKGVLRQEFVVAGWSDPSGSRAAFGALLLGAYDDGTLVYCGRVGTGFTQVTLKSIHEELLDRARSRSPFDGPVNDPEARTAHWVQPELVADVEFASWTQDGLIRFPVFRGLRPDIDPRQVKLERVAAAEGVAEAGQEAEQAAREQGSRQEPKVMQPRGGKSKKKPQVVTRIVKSSGEPSDAIVAGVRISNPDRIVYPDERITKREVAEYYAQVADWILPRLVDRPLSIVRCPIGLTGEQFFQRHVGKGFPEAIKGVNIEGDDEGPVIVIRDLEGLLSLVQFGVLEIHPWGAKADRPDRPDHLIFDLDPGPGIEWEHIVESARFLRKYLSDLGLESFVKTSGGAGAHLLIPIQRRIDWTEAKAFTKAIADDLARIAPRNFVAIQTKAMRAGRIYIDYLRNQQGATAVGAWSTRAREAATVSTPLSWDELSPSRLPAEFNIRSVLRRVADLKSDPWEGFDTIRQSITKEMREAVG
jgi:bifunctional non-homologous end joining protein LigD